MTVTATLYHNMPSLVLQSNVKLADTKDFSVEFAKLSAEVLGKPLKYIAVCYEYNESLSFAGTFDPAFLLTINSLGNITPQQNLKYSKAFFDYFKQKLGAPGDRGYIVFNDPKNGYLGHEGTTFETIFGPS